MKKLIAILSVVLFANQASADVTYNLGDVFVCEPQFHLSTYNRCFHIETSNPWPCGKEGVGKKETIIERVEPLETFVFKLTEMDWLGEPRIGLEFNRTIHFADLPELMVVSRSNEGSFRYMTGGNFDDATFNMNKLEFSYASSSSINMQLIKGNCEKF